MPTTFLQYALRENRPLFAMMHSFNFHLALHVHPARFEDRIPPAIVQLLFDSRRGERKLTAWVQEHWQLSTQSFWEFSNPRHRLALISPAQLTDLICYAGAAVHSHVISRAIDRNTKTRFKEALGEGAYHFALKRAPLLSRGIPQDVFADLEADGPPEQRLNYIGLVCVAACFGDSPPALNRRLMLKVQGDAPLDIAAQMEEGQRDRIWSMLKRILFTEVAPELKPCFN